MRRAVVCRGVPWCLWQGDNQRMLARRSLAHRLFAWCLWTLLLATLGACAVMTPNECKTANWYDVGLRDGLAGEAVGELNARTKACAEAGVQANALLYLQGRNQGLETYCRIDNAVRLGLDGKAYQGVCAPAIDPEFRRRYMLGREVYLARGALHSLDGRRHALEERLREARSDEDRRRLRDDLTDLDRSMRRARDRLREVEWALERLR